MHKGKTYIMFTVIVALAVSTMLIIILNNNVILLDRHNINVSTDITAENAYDFVLALTEKNQHAIPFYLLLDIAPNSDFPLFSIYSYEKMGNSGLFCVHTYDFCKEYVVQSKYIANAQNFKDWAPNLWLSSDSGFSQKAKRVYAGALLDIKANAETAIAFPLAYCGSVVYTNSGFIYTVE